MNPQIKDLYDFALDNAKRSIDWYTKNSKPKRRFSKISRWYSIIILGLASVAPILKATGIIKGAFDISSWGYLLLAIAGILMLLDRFGGFSTSWMRYITAQLEIDKAQEAFRFKWAQNTFGLNWDTLTPAKAVELLGHIEAFNSSVNMIIENETNAWITEFKSNLTELQSMIKTRTAEYMKTIEEKKTAEAEIKKQRYVIAQIDNKSNLGFIELKLTSPDGEEYVMHPGRMQKTEIFKDLKPVRYIMDITAKKDPKAAAEVIDKKMIDLTGKDQEEVRLKF